MCVSACFPVTREKDRVRERQGQRHGDFPGEKSQRAAACESFRGADWACDQSQVQWKVINSDWRGSGFRKLLRLRGLSGLSGPSGWATTRLSNYWNQMALIINFNSGKAIIGQRVIHTDPTQSESIRLAAQGEGLLKYLIGPPTEWERVASSLFYSLIET